MFDGSLKEVGPEGNAWFKSTLANPYLIKLKSLKFPVLFLILAHSPWRTGDRLVVFFQNTCSEICIASLSQEMYLSGLSAEQPAEQNCYRIHVAFFGLFA